MLYPCTFQHGNGQQFLRCQVPLNKGAEPYKVVFWGWEFPKKPYIILPKRRFVYLYWMGT